MRNSHPANRRYNSHDSELMGLDLVAISVKSHRLLHQLLSENPKLDKIMRYAKTEIEALIGIRNWVLDTLAQNSQAIAYYRAELDHGNPYELLSWRDFAAIRLLDYIDHAGMAYRDQNLRGVAAINNPIKMIWLAVNHGTGGARPPFFEDMIHLFRQFEGVETHEIPDRTQVEKWMSRFPSGLDPRIVKLREENRDRILNLIIDKIEAGEIVDRKYCFAEDLSPEQKFLQALEWWEDHRFHLRFAVRSAALLNQMLGDSLDPETMALLHRAEQEGIPIFVNPYYLSLLHVRVPYFAIGADLAIRHYVLYSKQLIDEFGHIVAWEKEDQVEPGKPNAAGWLLPSEYNIHRRYPEVAIFIPDTTGRACGGLCASCQRMYSFQKGRLNFDLRKLRPDKTWSERLQELLNYFEQDSQLRDILITGGDALMSSDAALEQILEGVYQMAKRKREANKKRPEGEKYAEIQRVRLGTRLPVYLPQRITPELSRILRNFQEKARRIGVRQFLIQTHIESPMEITPRVKEALRRFFEAGWLVTNQHVFTAAASRRGHNAKLRHTLGEVGVLPYYTFTVKGYMENSFNFAPNGRAVQEQIEEKVLGKLGEEAVEKLSSYLEHPEEMAAQLAALREHENRAFLASDRNVLNLPGVGKSLTFRVIGITRYGRRILQFDHDATRRHSPIIEKLGKIIIIESKSISEYLQQLSEMGEDPADYAGLFGYSIGITDPRLPIFDYPEYEFSVTEEMTNLDIS